MRRAACPAATDLKARARSLAGGQQAPDEVRAGGHAIGIDAATHARQNRGEQRVIDAGRDSAIERHAVHELDKRRFHVRHVAIAIHVLAIEVGDHARIGESLRKERSLSSASATRYCDLPEPRIRPHRVHRPPTTTVGSRPPPASTAAIMEVVVVLPCMPATAMPYFSRINSASISARWITGHLLARASTTSGLGSLTAELTTTTAAPSDVCGSMAFKDRRAQAGQPLGDGRPLQVRAGDGISQAEQYLGNPAHADPADSNEMNALRLGKHRGLLATLAVASFTQLF